MHQNTYFKNSYDYEGRFGSYWHQINEIFTLVNPGKTILEVGPGNNFMSHYVSQRNIGVETLDIITETNPTYVGTVTQIPCKENQFDCVCAFQVLEHQPLELLQLSLIEMLRVSKQYLLFSVPDVRWFLSLDLRIFSSRNASRQIVSFPRLTNRVLNVPQSSKDHHWEIGRPGCSLAKILRKIAAVESLQLQKHYRVPSNPIHHLFVISKKV
ncbi:MAG: class I SAM-dependent methyltransferase [Hormoscilla sp.]